MFFTRKPTLKIMPDKGVSYAVADNGEPEVVFYRPTSNLFVNRKIGSDIKGFFVNIRRPVIFNLEGVASFDLPEMPKECDGFILINYGTYKSKAYALRNPEAQTMSASM